MRKHAGWRLLGVVLVLALASMAATLDTAKAEACCSCHNASCYSGCYYECGSNEACLHACVDECEYWDSWCIDHCPFPIC
jgi:hypothetical protein